MLYSILFLFTIFYKAQAIHESCRAAIYRESAIERVGVPLSKRVLSTHVQHALIDMKGKSDIEAELLSNQRPCTACLISLCGASLPDEVNLNVDAIKEERHTRLGALSDDGTSNETRKSFSRKAEAEKRQTQLEIERLKERAGCPPRCVYFVIACGSECCYRNLC